MALTGPIAVPGTVAEINATNTEAFFTRDQFRVLPQDGEDDEAIGELTGEIFDRLGSADLPGPRELGERFGPLVRDGHLAMATGVDDDRALLDRTGLSAPLPKTDGDLLGIVERNVAPNKMDVFLNRTHNYDVAWDRRRRGTHRHADIDLHQRRGRPGPPAAGGGGQPDRCAGRHPDSRGVHPQPVAERQPGGERRTDARANRRWRRASIATA
ncbi:MAG: hypothetical protein IPG03_11405 [Candidatus Microthrix sp.]|nr:hypothetical protein [Candidatus Microthrix sp.]MBK6502944.1 hypothetical protein [Candidatus Microthrix sp.]